MKHITEKYGQPCNYIELTDEEFKQLEPFLKGLGIEIRAIMLYAGTGEYQARNEYKNELRFSNKAAHDRVTDRIEEGCWRR